MKTKWFLLEGSERETFIRNEPQTSIEADRWDEVGEMLTDIFFLEAKVEAGMLPGLLEGFTRLGLQPRQGVPFCTPLKHGEMKPMPVSCGKRLQLAIIEEALRRDQLFIEKHPTTLFQCLWNSCWWYDCPEAGKHYPGLEVAGEEIFPPWERPGEKLYQLVESWRHAKEKETPSFQWLRAHRPPQFPLGGNSRLFFLRGYLSDPSWNQEFSPDGKRLLFSAKGEIVIFDSENGKELIKCPNPAGDQAFSTAKFSPDGSLIVCDTIDPWWALKNSLTGEGLAIFWAF